MKKITKRKAGRPKLKDGKAFVTVSLRLTREMMEWLEDQTNSRLDRPNKSVVAREIFAEKMGDKRNGV